jgi:hypothetical protein
MLLCIKYFNFKLFVTGLSICRAGIEEIQFQNRTEPIRLFIFPFFMPIVKDELAVIEQGENAGTPSPLA